MILVGSYRGKVLDFDDAIKTLMKDHVSYEMVKCKDGKYRRMRLVEKGVPRDRIFTAQKELGYKTSKADTRFYLIRLPDEDEMSLCKPAWESEEGAPGSFQVDGGWWSLCKPEEGR